MPRHMMDEHLKIKANNNQLSKENKKQKNQKGRSKTVLIQKWHDSLCRNCPYKTPRTN
jgi:hypothetical protein